jgi:ubiquinone/menaquinone biosynthesis C-methylase UbiE
MTTTPSRLQSLGSAQRSKPDHVAESRFGIWFLGTRIWTVHVLYRALNDLCRLISGQAERYPTVLDVGCGWGQSVRLLKRRFSPDRLIAIDVDAHMLRCCAETLRRQSITAELRQASAADIPLPDASVDLVFCHQTFHHLVRQEEAAREFMRVLRPGGLLLFAESTKAYIDLWLIRMLFRHPMQVQKTADQYVALLRNAGFLIRPDAISLPYHWWSRRDLGMMEHVFGISPRANHAETVINLVAVKPTS